MQWRRLLFAHPKYTGRLGHQNGGGFFVKLIRTTVEFGKVILIYYFGTSFCHRQTKEKKEKR